MTTTVRLPSRKIAKRYGFLTIRERWIRSIRAECLDRIVIFDQRHLDSVLKTYTRYYNELRPHQGLHQHMSIPSPTASGTGAVQRRDLLDGLLHHYERAA